MKTLLLVALLNLNQPPPIYPPASLFALPPSVLGTPQRYHGQSLWRPRGMDASSVGRYRWFIALSANGAQTRDYLHHQAVRSGCVGPGPCWPGLPRPSITVYPPGGWVLGRYDGAAGAYAYSAGAVFRNLTFTVDAWCHIPRATDRDACQAWTTSTLAQLLRQARGYAQTHLGGDPLA